MARFFVFHFFLPFIIAGLVMVHIVYLHDSGSNNPIGLRREGIKITFYPYFASKDMVGFVTLIFLLTSVVIFDPFVLGDPENFNTANILVTPIHIQPEWYYLFAYAILRSIPRKFGGVIALVVSIAILYVKPFMVLGKYNRMKFYKVNKILFWVFVRV